MTPTPLSSARTLPADARRAALGPPWRVLVVDDDPFQHEFLKALLAELRIHDVTCVDAGAKALDKIRSGIGFNLMLLDLMMPGMDGFEFMEAAERQGFNGGLIIVSGQDDVVRHGATLVARMRSFRLLGQIEKPADKQALASLLAFSY